jgi:hypothetical protein
MRDGDESMAQPRQVGMFDSCLNKGYKQVLEETAYRYETCCSTERQRPEIQVYISNVTVVTMAHDVWRLDDHWRSLSASLSSPVRMYTVHK